MVDLEKENKLFAEYNMREPHSPDEECELVGWIARAELADAEEFKYKSLNGELIGKLHALQKKLARYENPDYVLVPKVPCDKMLTALYDALEVYYDDWSFNADLAYKGLIEAVENDDESNN